MRASNFDFGTNRIKTPPVDCPTVLAFLVEEFGDLGRHVYARLVEVAATIKEQKVGDPGILLTDDGGYFMAFSNLSSPSDG